MRLARYEALFDESPLPRLWQLMGVEHVLTWRDPTRMPQAELLSWFPAADGATFLYRLQTLNPRAWVVNNILVVEDTQALKLLADPGFDLNRAALLPSSVDWAPVFFISGHNEVSMQRLSPNRLRVHVQSEYGGVLVISENWMPGWRATRYDVGSKRGSGEPLPLARANLTLLGMPVPPGESEIELLYWPDSVRYGLLISGTTLALLGLFVLWHWYAKRSVIVPSTQ